MEDKVVLFDGVCNLCNGAVQFIIRHDKRKLFRFASLQSETGQQYLSSFQLPADYLNSFILVENGRVYKQSDAALRVARHLSGLWPLLYACIIVPAFIRNAVYKLIANNRYKWFGKQTRCWLPTPDLRSRFL